MGGQNSSHAERLGEIKCHFDDPDIQTHLESLYADFIRVHADKECHEAFTAIGLPDGFDRLLANIDAIMHDPSRLPPYPINDPPAAGKLHKDSTVELHFWQAAHLFLHGSTDQKGLILHTLWKQVQDSTVAEWFHDIVSFYIPLYCSTSKYLSTVDRYSHTMSELVRRLSSGGHADPPVDGKIGPSDIVNLDPDGIKVSDRHRYLVWYRANIYAQRIGSSLLHAVLLHGLTRSAVRDSESTKTDKERMEHLSRVVCRLRNDVIVPPTLGNSPPKTIICPEHVWFLHYNLPAECRQKWTCLFSSSYNGHSWNSFTQAVELNGRILLVVRDKLGHVFGGYVADELERRPDFFGSSANFLFALHPTIQLFRTTGYNNHYQYYEDGMQSLPNGIGFGGQLEHFGLFLAADLLTGHSHANTTYWNPVLSRHEEFDIADVEVWQVHPPERDDSDDEAIGGRRRGKRAPGSSRAQVMNFLEMAGVQTYSKTMGPPVNEDDPENEEDDGMGI